MAPGHIFQIFLRVTVQNQIGIAQRVIIDEIIQLRPLRHGYIQRVFNPGAVDGDFSPIKKRFGFSILAADLPVDIPTGWEPQAKQQPTGLIAYGAARRRLVQVLLSAVTAKGKLPCKTKKTATKSCLPCGASSDTAFFENNRSTICF